MLLGTDPPRLPVALLVRTTELFGIADGATRTALSRMVASGELSVEGGVYRIASQRLLERQARQSASREATTAPWRDGRWIVGIVQPGRRSPKARALLRSELSRARFAELREGVWTRPDNLGGAPTITGDTVRWFSATPMGDPSELAATLFDMDGWADRALELEDRMGSLIGPLESGDRAALAEGFVLSAAVLRHFQADPLLPDELLPPTWPGQALRHHYDRYDAAYRRVLADWFAEHRSGD